MHAPSPFTTLLRYGRKQRGALIALAVMLSFLPIAVLVRKCVERQTLAVALRSVGMLGKWAKEPLAQPGDDTEFLPLLPQFGDASQLRPDQTGAPRHPSQGGHLRTKGGHTDQKWAAPPVLPPPVSRHVPAEQVLSWVSARMMPVGRKREASFGLPAGIELSSVAALGIGLLDGDRLVAVDGVAVSERAQVVSLVLSARGRHKPKLVATLWRRTPLGPRAFHVVVDQPYPHLPAASDVETTSAAVDPAISGAPLGSSAAQ